MNNADSTLLKMMSNHCFYQYASASLAFFIWGGWTFYINYELSIDSALISALVQGIASFAGTLFLVSMIHYFYAKFSSKVTKLIGTACVCTLIVAVGLIFIHKMVNTPRVIYTVAPILMMTFSFSLITSYRLWYLVKA